MGQYLTPNTLLPLVPPSLHQAKKERMLQVSLSSADLPPGPKSSMMQQGPTQIPHLTLNLFLLCSFLKMLLPPSRPTPGAPQGLLLLPIHGPRVCLLPLNISLSSPVLSSHSEPACSPLIHPMLNHSTCSPRQQKEDSGFEPQPSPSHRGNVGRDLTVLTHLTCSLQTGSMTHTR